ncbi:MAG TPA: ABC transporter substrate-binding protein [Methylomirabilota bacterium]|nr:ABC transporter substrate-binding protein [Methylomirabilota bacterium]
MKATAGRARSNATHMAHLLALTLCCTILSPSALAQQAPRPRIGYLISDSYLHPEFAMLLRVHLTPVGGVQPHYGSTILTRSARSAGDLAALATDLVNGQVDVIVAEGTSAALAAKAATRLVPIVMAIGGDPVQAGLVANLARPGGNVTGVTSFSLELVAKRLQLIKEIVPSATRVAVLWNPASAEKELEWKALRLAASQLNVTLHSLEVRRANAVEPLLDGAVKQRAAGLLVLDDSLTLSLARDITTAAETRRLPAIYGWDFYVRPPNNGLVAYGPTAWDLTARVANYVDRILRGAKPGDLPVEQPARFELTVNIEAAKVVGLTLPQSILVRADRLLE